MPVVMIPPVAMAEVVHLGGAGLVALTGCGHTGIVNIVRRAQQLTGVDQVQAVVGDFRLRAIVEQLPYAFIQNSVGTRFEPSASA